VLPSSQVLVAMLLPAALAGRARVHARAGVTRYYLSLGDSLAQGMQPDTAGITRNIGALLAAARQLDDEAREDRRHVERHAILSTLTFAGLRIGELCALRWRDIDLAAGWLHVGPAKTEAGRRKVKLRGALRDALVRMRADLDRAEPDAYVFATRSGKRPSGDNIRTRVLGAAIKRANANLGRAGPPAAARAPDATLAATDVRERTLRAR
jgi:integrase